MLKNLKSILVFSLLIFFTLVLSAQTNDKIDSLENLLKKEKNSIVKIEVLNSLSSEMLSFDLIKSTDYAQTALKLSETEKNDKLIALSSLSIGNAYYFRGKLDSAFFFLNNSLKIYKQQNSKKDIAKVFVSVGNYYKDKNMIDSALYYFENAKKIAEDIKNQEIVAIVLLNYGALYSNNLADYSAAEEYTLKALDIINKLKNKKLEIQAYYNLGIIRKNINDEIKAEEYFLTALDYYVENNYEMKQLNVYWSLGTIFYIVDNNEKAKFYYNKLLQLSIKKQYNNGMAAAYHNIANILQNENKIDSAISYFLNAEKINLQTGNKYWLSNNYSELSYCYLEKNDFVPAYNYIKLTIEIDINLKDSSSLCDNYNYLAQIYLRNSKLDSAVYFFNISNEIAFLFDEKETIKDNYRFLSQIYEKKSDFKNAFYFLKKSKEISDSLISLEKKEIVEELEIKYNVSKKDIEIEKNKSVIQNLEKDNKIKALSNFILTTFILSLIIIIVILYRFVTIKNRRKTEKLEYEKILLEKNTEIKENQLNKAKSEIKNQAFLILGKNKIISEIREELSAIKDIHSSNISTEIEKISELLSTRILTEDNWTNFKQKFNDVYPHFIYKLNANFGKLSAGEIRLACLIKLNINNKDIGSMLGISPESVIKSKYRFRKKINLADDKQLDELIAEI
ncbi:MAG: hypothetical protein JXR68_12850 [Bacteroidales bacterium]|nr:hypothetical protein [Bacteroidales bacterium]